MFSHAGGYEGVQTDKPLKINTFYFHRKEVRRWLFFVLKRPVIKIIVMEKGHLIEEGKHDELVDAGGRYAQMWNHYTEAIGWKISGKAV